MAQPSIPGWILIERPNERIVITTPTDSPQSIALLLDYLARSGVNTPMGTHTLPGIAPCDCELDDAHPTPHRALSAHLETCESSGIANFIPRSAESKLSR